MRSALSLNTGMAGILVARRAPIIACPAYANTITGIIGQLYAGLNTISRELVGFIPSVRRDTTVERAAVGQTVPFPIVPAQTATDIVPAMQVPTPPDNNIGTGNMALTKARKVPFGWTGEEQKALNNGVGYNNIQADLFAEGLRTLVNEIEGDLGNVAMLNASRAYGTAGTVPFGSGDLTDVAQVRKILDDNGAPASGRSLVVNTAAGAKLRAIPNLTRVNENGSSMTLRDGVLLDLHGFGVKESAGVQDFVAGTNNGAASTNNAGYAIGATVITLAAAGTGTFKAGDVVTIAGDANKYVIASGDADVSNGGTITLQKPGLRKAIAASNTVITTIASHSANVGFSQNALALAMRLPALPQGGDLAIDRETIVDPRSGLMFEVSLYPGYRMIEAEVAAVWGVGAPNPAHIAMLLG